MYLISLCLSFVLYEIKYVRFCYANINHPLITCTFYYHCANNKTVHVKHLEQYLIINKCSVHFSFYFTYEKIFFPYLYFFNFNYFFYLIISYLVRSKTDQLSRIYDYRGQSFSTCLACQH